MSPRRSKAAADEQIEMPSRNVDGAKRAGVGERVGRGVRVGSGVHVGSGVRVGVIVGGSTLVGVTSTSGGYSSSMAEYQSSPPVSANSVKRAPR